MSPLRSANLAMAPTGLRPGSVHLTAARGRQFPDARYRAINDNALGAVLTSRAALVADLRRVRRLAEAAFFAGDGRRYGRLLQRLRVLDRQVSEWSELTRG